MYCLKLILLRQYYLSLEKYKQIINKEFTKDIDFIDETIKNLNLGFNSKILDIGTGIGAMAILLALNDFNVITGEPKEEPERVESDHCEHQHEGIHEGSFKGYWTSWKESAKAIGVEEMIKYQYFNAENMPFSAESFDGIFMYDTLQHIHNRELALNECIRVLKPDGKLCVIEWSEKSIKEEKEKYGYEIYFIDPTKFIKLDDIATEILKGEYVNVYLIHKKKHMNMSY